MELTHFSPKLKPLPESKVEQLLLKSESFKELIEKYRGIGISKVIIEEPLLNPEPSTYEVAFGSDLFHNDVPLEFQRKVFETK